MGEKFRSITWGSIIEFLVLVVGIWALTPTIKNSINQMYPVIISMVCLLFMIFSMHGKIHKSFASTLFVIIFIVIYKLLGISDDTWANHSNIFMYLFAMLASEYLLINLPQRRIKKCAIFLVGVVLINLAYQYFLYFTLGTTLYSTKSLLAEGIVAGGTSFVSDMMLIAMLFTVICFLKVDTKIKIFSLIVIAASFYYVINIQTRATALIVLTMFIVACFAIGFSKQITPNRLFVFLGIIACLCVILPIVVNMVATSDNAYFARKFSAIQNMISGTSVIEETNLKESSLVARLYVAGVSLNTWTSSIIRFFFGKGYDAGFYYISGIGKHSELIDIFPKYGLIGFCLFAYAFIEHFRFVASYIKNPRCFWFPMIAVVVYSILNGIFLPDFGYVANIIIPFVLVIINGTDEEDTEYSVQLKSIRSL